MGLSEAFDNPPTSVITLGDIQIQCDNDSQLYFPELHQEQDLVFLTLALAGEVGEIANEIKKWRRGDGDEYLDRAARELPDALIYLSLLANALGVNLTEAYIEKREFNNGRYLG